MIFITWQHMNKSIRVLWDKPIQNRVLANSPLFKNTGIWRVKPLY